MVETYKDDFREGIRPGFFNRLISAWGDVSKIVASTHFARSTVYNWKKENEALPDLADLELLALAKGVSPAWLAFKQGPRDLATANAAEKLGTLLEITKGLRQMISAYIATNDKNRGVLLQVAEAMTTAPAAMPAPAPGELPPLHVSRSELAAVLAGLGKLGADRRYTSTQAEQLRQLSRRLAAQGDAHAPKAIPDSTAPPPDADEESESPHDKY